MKKIITWIVILAIVGGVGYWQVHKRTAGAKNAKPTFSSTQVERRDLRTTVESTGEVQPRNRLSVTPPIAGRLEELLVDEGDKVTKGQILGWISSTERATLLDAARATSEDELAYWSDLYKPSPLISPLDGTIIARKFEPGQSIGANDSVVVIADDLIVVANLDETDIGLIKNEQVVEVSLEAYPDRPFPCVVEKIAYDAKTVSNVTMYEVDVRPEHILPFMRSGMTANLEFVIEEKKNTLVVISSAVQAKTSEKKEEPSSRFKDMDPNERLQAMAARMKERGMSQPQIDERLAQMKAEGPRSGGKGGGGKRDKAAPSAEGYVLVASDNPDEPQKIAIKTGISNGSYIEILEGLEEGDTILIQEVSFSSSKKSSGKTSFTQGGGRR